MKTQTNSDNVKSRFPLMPAISLGVTMLLLIVVGIQTWHINTLGDQVAKLKSRDRASEPKTEIKIKEEKPQADATRKSSQYPFGPDWFSRPFDDASWDPFQEMEDMREQMNRMFDGSFGRFGLSSRFGGLSDSRSFTPNIDLTEDDGNYIVTVDVPGVDDKNISVTLKGQTLTIIGSIEEVIENESKTQLRKERRSGKFSRSLTLPGPVEEMGMKTSFENGVMTIRIAKKKI